MNCINRYIIQKSTMDQQVKAFQSDKELMRTLLGNFGHVLWNQPSSQYLENFTNSIDIFGQYDNVKYFSICAQKCPDIFKKFNVEKTPTVLVTQTDKKILFKSESDDIGAIFEALSTITQEHKNQFEKDKTVWHPKIQSILDSCPVIVFIKGTPTNPKCGFTSTLLEILKNHETEYIFYDIIEDEYMRYWLRHYKGWGTYPQLFINGEFIGGLDKIKEHVAKDEFKAMIPQSSRKKSAEERYNTYLNDKKSIVFVDGFSFENKNSEMAIKEAKEKHGNVSIYNVGIDDSMKEYLTGTMKLKLPFVVKQGKIE